MDRRHFLASGLLLGSGLLAGTLAACSGRPESDMPSPSSGTPSTPTSPTSTGVANSEAPSALTASDNRVLLAYFSRPGENYYYGDRITIEVGNTQVVAEMIAAAISADVYRIEAADPYPESYAETVARNVKEGDANARPAIANPLPDVTRYDTVLLGTPVWNVQTPMIMRTFVEGVDLSGKMIHPFVTHAVSGMGRVAGDYTELCPRSTVGEGLAVQGEEAAEAGPDVAAWLRQIGL